MDRRGRIVSGRPGASAGDRGAERVGKDLLAETLGAACHPAARRHHFVRTRPGSNETRRDCSYRWSRTTRHTAALSLYSCGNGLNGTISSSSSKRMGKWIWMGKRGGCGYCRGCHEDDGRCPLGPAGGNGPFWWRTATDDDCASLGSDTASIVA